MSKPETEEYIAAQFIRHILAGSVGRSNLVVIDAPNLRTTLRQIESQPQLDYLKMREWFEQHTDLRRIALFIPKKNALNQFHDLLLQNGYTVVDKLGTVDDKTSHSVSGDLIVWTMDYALENRDKLDTVTIFSGDGVYLPMVRWLQRKGFLVNVVSVKGENSPLSTDLRRACDHCIDLPEFIAGAKLDRKDNPSRGDYEKMNFEPFEAEEIDGKAEQEKEAVGG